MTVFELLHPDIQKALHKLGFGEPTEPQVRAIPKLLEGKNLLLIAPTGIGKTEAAVLPLFHKLLVSKARGLSLLYITPLRALNRDMLRRMEWFAEELGFAVGVRHSDTPQSERIKQMKSPPQMLITTPETFQLLLAGKNLRERLRSVRWVVVDEVHELADNERGSQLAVGLERLCAHIGNDVQRIGLSATVGSPEIIARFLAGEGREIEVIKVSLAKGMKVVVEYPKVMECDTQVSKTIHLDVEQTAAMRRCRELVEGHNSTLFFVNTRDTAEALASRYRLWDENMQIGIHHGSLSKEIRVQMEDDFKAGRLKALICTSSLELGIDVGSADFTLQYNSPRDVTRLIQRVGRAGHRFGLVSEGAVVSTFPDELLESCVIAGRVLTEELEDLRIRENPLTVLANQVVAFSMVGEKIENIYMAVTRAHQFRNLERREFDDVVELLNEFRIIRLDSGFARKGRSAIKYFIDNISMIPDEKTFRVVDVTVRRPIATLDESFVSTFLAPYVTFIVKGVAWRVIEVKEGEVVVEPIRDIGAIPSWAGEEIPVPYDVAQEVGRLREKRDWDSYPIHEATRNKLNEYLDSEGKFPMPSDRLLTLECTDRLIVLNACFGTKVNHTLGRLLSSFLIARLGESVGMQFDAYRIYLELPRKVEGNRVKEILLSTKPETVPSLVRLVLRNSSLLKWQFVYAGKKFGLIDKGADFRLLNLEKLIDMFKSTPIYKEALEKTIWETLDIEKTAEVLRDIQTGNIEVRIVHRISPIGMSGYESRRELIVPERADHTILMALRNRLIGEDIILFCVRCQSQLRLKVKDTGDRIRCQSCGGVMVAAVRPYDKEGMEAISLVKKRKAVAEKGAAWGEARRGRSGRASERGAVKGIEGVRGRGRGRADEGRKGRRLAEVMDKEDTEGRKIERLYKNANLVMAHGKKALMCLVGKGIGADTAARILERGQENEEELLKDILRAEINYARTKRFWD